MVFQLVALYHNSSSRQRIICAASDQVPKQIDSWVYYESCPLASDELAKFAEETLIKHKMPLIPNMGERKSHDEVVSKMIQGPAVHITSLALEMQERAFDPERDLVDLEQQDVAVHWLNNPVKSTPQAYSHQSHPTDARNVGSRSPQSSTVELKQCIEQRNCIEW